MSSASTAPVNSRYIVVSSIRAKGTLPKARYFIRISLGKQELETTKAKPHESSLEWATPVTLAVEEPKSTSLTLKLYSIPKDSVLRFAKKSGPVSVGKQTASWDDTNSQVASREVTFGDIVTSFNLQVSTIEKVVEKDLNDAAQATQAIRQLSVSEDLDLGGRLVGNLQPALDAAQPFLEKFEAVVMLMDKVTKVHPYLNAAWVVLSAIPKVYIQELAQNKQVMDLLESLNDTYKCILKDENLQQLDSQNIQELIALLENHTRECAYFIQSHASKSHQARLYDTVFASPEKRIDGLLKRLEELQKKLTNLLTQAAAVGAMQSKHGVATAVKGISTAIEGIAFVGEGLEDLSQKIDLNDIPYADGVSYDEKKCCLPDTRTSILQQIRDWVDCFDEEETEKVFVLTGLVGSGKSSIAHSICRHYDQLHRLGSSFFFVRSTETPGGDKVFSTIAQDIADKFLLFKASLASIVKKDRSLRRTKQPSKQFKSFIVKSSQALAESEVLSVGPVLLVIDALDECPEDSREELVQTLVEDLPNLPPNFRVLITSRPDEVEDLLKAPFVRHVDLSTIGHSEAEADIRLFITQRTTKVAHKLNDPQEEPHHGDWLEQLVQRSEGLFIWADTVCKQITSPKTRAPAEVLNAILKNGGSGIDDLYKLALERAVGDDPQSLADFKAVMSRLIILKWPMSVNEMNFMRRFVDAGDFPRDVSFLISHLGALLGGALNFTEHIHFLHTSFRDFLLDEKRSGVFCIDEKDNFAAAHLSLANTCAAVLGLFNSMYDRRLWDETNRRPIGYSFLFAKHLEESGRKLDADLLGSVDTEAMLRWSYNHFLPKHGVNMKEWIAIDEGWNSLLKLEYDPAKYMTKLQASPPTGYSWIIETNDQNPFKLRSRDLRISVSNPTWSTSVCALAPAGCLDWGSTLIAFLSPQNTILVWDPCYSEYYRKPIELGKDEVVEMTFDFHGLDLSVLTSEHHLVLFEVESGTEICRVVMDPPKGLPTCFFSFVSNGLVLLKFPNTEESPAFDTRSSTLYPNIDSVSRLTPSQKDWMCDIWDKFREYDELL